MQSSSMKDEKLRFSAASHSEPLSWVGDSVAIDKAEPADPGLRLAFTPAPEDQPRGGADPARDHEADGEGAGGDRRKVGAELALDVRCLSDALAQRVCGVGELLAFRLDIAADVLEGTCVPSGHRSSALPSSAWPRESPAPGP